MNGLSERERRVLEERAQLLARNIEQNEEKSDVLEVVLCTVAKEVFALPVVHLREVVLLPAVTALPHCPDWLMGVAHVRGNLMSVLCLGKFCHAKGESRPEYLAVVEGTDGPLGLAIDKVQTCQMIALSSLVSGEDRSERRVTMGVTPQMATVLDVPRLLALPEIVIE